MSPVLKRYNGSAFERVGSISAFNSGPAATLAYAEKTTDQNGMTGTTDITGLSVTVTVPAGRRIRVSGYAHFLQNTSASIPQLYVREGATVLNGAISTGGAISEHSTAAVSWVGSPTAGTHTYKLSTWTGAGTLDLKATATDIAFILVEDITGSTLPYNPASVPVGTLAYAPVVTNQTGIPAATATTITGLTVNVAVPAGRTLKVTGYVLASSPSAGLMETTLRMDGAVIGRFHDGAVAAAELNSQTPIAIISPTAGAHVFDLQLYMSVGVGQTYADSIRPVYLLVEDITPTPSASSGAPGSTLGYAEVTANQTGITTVVDLTGLSVNVTVPAGRRLRITGCCLVNRTVADGIIQLGIKEGATTFQLANMRPAGTGSETIRAECVISPSAGAHTYKLTLERSDGTGTVNMVAGATFPAYILVEDVTGSLWPAGSSITAGMVASEAWTDYTPTLTQSAAVAKTVPYARYYRLGRKITFEFLLYPTATGTGGSAVTISLPVAAAQASNLVAGSGFINDASANVNYGGVAVLNSTTTCAFLPTSTDSANFLGVVVMTAALASGDAVSGIVTYEAAA